MTLTELLVVIAIIVIISTIMVLNFRVGERGGELVRSAQLVVQGIRKAQNMALGSKEVENPAGGWEVPVGGYGVDLSKTDNDYYVIFADFNGNNGRDSGEDIETVELEEGIIIDYIFYDPSRAAPSSTKIIFNPLEPLIELRPWIPPADQIFITIKKEEGEDCSSSCQQGNGGCSQDCKVIKLLKAGWVSIVD